MHSNNDSTLKNCLVVVERKKDQIPRNVKERKVREKRKRKKKGKVSGMEIQGRDRVK